ncbi:unnamed protein product, partial [Heterotrigona itama]
GFAEPWTHLRAFGRVTQLETGSHAWMLIAIADFILPSPILKVEGSCQFSMPPRRGIPRMLAIGGSIFFVGKLGISADNETKFVEDYRGGWIP